MVNILVPTDLSDLSKVALQYAIKIANKLDGTITLLHVINIIQPTRATMRLRLNALEQELLDIAREDLEALLKEVSKHVKTTEPIKVRIVKGASFNDTVKREAKKLRTGLIVMGTRGASGLKKYVLGSNTASVIEVSHVPVLAVPELGDFKHFKNVVYATDLKYIENELKILIPYLERFDSTVHLIHIASTLKEVAAVEKRIESVVERCGFKNVIFRVMVNKKIDEAIDHYVGVIKADLLTMFTHDASFYEKLFNRSITRKMAFQSKVPLLAFKQRG
ncbi:MAG: universal stress protein [Nitrosomonadales bacterium]|nr:MAG: universal stress protein [Nitrosomonadales bacterium]